MLSHRAALWLLTAILATTAAMAVFFEAFPRFDLAASAIFAGGAIPFPMHDAPFWQIARLGMIALTDGTMVALLGLLIAGRALPNWRLPRPDVLGFALLCYAAGPGLIANALFKRRWGRARPINVADFGGPAQFTPPLQPADQCRGSCAFISGEASALFTVATLTLLIVVPWLPRRARAPVSVAVLLIACAGSALRIAFGGHFLSDVIFAALLSSAATLALYLALGMDRLTGLLVAPRAPVDWRRGAPPAAPGMPAAPRRSSP